MDALVTVLMTWLAFNFTLPAELEPPEVRFVSEREMLELRVAADLGNSAVTAQMPAPSVGAPYGVHAVYDDERRTILLPEGWTGTTPAEVSVLVHELVHHLQNVADIPYDCPEAREKLAYQAQDSWLALFGETLAEEFELDPMTRLLRTSCLR